MKFFKYSGGFEKSRLKRVYKPTNYQRVFEEVEAGLVASSSGGFRGVPRIPWQPLFEIQQLKMSV